jgi:hypothetical protein
MKRRFLIGTATMVLLAMALTAAACGGGATEAQKSLDGALKDYQSAVDRVKQLDLRTAAKEDVAAARAKLDTSWQNVQEWSQKAGSDAASTLKSAYGQLNDALGKAATGAKTGLTEAEKAVEKAADSVRSKLDAALSKLKQLF